MFDGTRASCEWSSRFHKAHFAQVVLEPFTAIQANDVTLAVGLARLGDGGHGPSKAAVRATKQEVQHGVDHKRSNEAPRVDCGGMLGPNAAVIPSFCFPGFMVQSGEARCQLAARMVFATLAGTSC